MDRQPLFGIGQTEGVAEYCGGVFERFRERAGIAPADAARLRDAFFASLHACEAKLAAELNAGMTEPLPEGRRLLAVLGELLVKPESELKGKEHLDEAFAFLEQGGNVLLIQNHRSGADTLVTEALVARAYGPERTADWAYMSGHAVNLYLLPYVITSGMRRVQIFSRKYQSMAAAGGVMQDTGGGEELMRAQNIRALRSLGAWARPGGKLVGLYPEGGRGDDEMKTGDPFTVAVPEMVARCSPKGLKILPTYVDGATSILPVRRTPNEYNEFLEHASSGAGTLTVGPLVPWETVRSVLDAQMAEGERLRSVLPFPATEDDKLARKQLVMGLLMARIAELAPTDKDRGPYRDPALRGLVGSLLAGE